MKKDRKTSLKIPLLVYNFLKKNKSLKINVTDKFALNIK